MGLIEDFLESDDDDGQYLVTDVFKASWNGDCAIDHWHKIRRGDLIGRVVVAENPLVLVRGYACAVCVKSFPRLAE